MRQQRNTINIRSLSKFPNSIQSHLNKLNLDPNSLLAASSPFLHANTNTPRHTHTNKQSKHTNKKTDSNKPNRTLRTSKLYSYASEQDQILFGHRNTIKRKLDPHLFRSTMVNVSGRFRSSMKVFYHTFDNSRSTYTSTIDKNKRIDIPIFHKTSKTQ